jgi:RNA polymerase sigma-70 factor, ECF subfamily
MDDAQRSSLPPVPLRVGSDPGSLEFRDFFEREYERLGEALRVLTGGNVPEAEDVAQEAMVRVYERWGRVRGMDSPTGYLYRTALNLYRSRIRRVLRFPKRALVGDVRPPDPTEAIDTQDLLARLLDTIPMSQRQALVLVEMVGMTAEEAGRVLGIEPVSVRVRISRARAALREQSDGLHG